MTFIAPARMRGDRGRALGTHRSIVRAASAASNAFLWIFIFQYFALFDTVGRALVQTLLLYALVQTVTMLLSPFAMRRMRGGMLRGLIYGTLLMAAALTYIGALLGGLFPHGTAMIGILLGAYGALYRVPYTVERAAIGRGRVPGLTGEVLLACAPLLAGICFAFGVPPHMLFFVLAVLAASALVPLLYVPNVYEKFSWNYRETFGHFAAVENRALLVSSLKRGIFGALLFLAWPLILIFLTQSYVGVGAAFSATILGILLFRSPQRRVFIDQHADGGAYLDEYTCLKEMGLALGRLIVCLVSALVILLPIF